MFVFVDFGDVAGGGGKVRRWWRAAGWDMVVAATGATLLTDGVFPWPFIPVGTPGNTIPFLSIHLPN